MRERRSGNVSVGRWEVGEGREIEGERQSKGLDESGTGVVWGVEDWLTSESSAQGKWGNGETATASRGYQGPGTGVPRCLSGACTVLYLTSPS